MIVSPGTAVTADSIGTNATLGIAFGVGRPRVHVRGLLATLILAGKTGLQSHRRHSRHYPTAPFPETGARLSDRVLPVDGETGCDCAESTDPAGGTGTGLSFFSASGAVPAFAASIKSRGPNGMPAFAGCSTGFQPVKKTRPRWPCY